MTFNPTKALVKAYLEQPHKHEWTLQGFGMLRTYLPDDFRLHVWDSRFQVPHVSLIHDHPWHFESQIIVGRMNNRRYEVYNGATHYERQIKPGEGFKVLGQDKLVGLRLVQQESITEGQRYVQRADEIHSTDYSDGTVSIVKRQRQNMPDVARVYYDAHKEWVSGEPRKATMNEIDVICGRALDNF